MRSTAQGQGQAERGCRRDLHSSRGALFPVHTVHRRYPACMRLLCPALTQWHVMLQLNEARQKANRSLESPGAAPLPWGMLACRHGCYGPRGLPCRTMPCTLALHTDESVVGAAGCLSGKGHAVSGYSCSLYAQDLDKGLGMWRCCETLPSGQQPEVLLAPLPNQARRSGWTAIGSGAAQGRGHPGAGAGARGLRPRVRLPRAAPAWRSTRRSRARPPSATSSAATSRHAASACCSRPLPAYLPYQCISTPHACMMYTSTTCL